jgi:O-antigen/teichoic acid export membrane protein
MTVSKAKTFRNLIYTVLNKGAVLVCIAVTSSVVARNLSPSDYGVLGFAAIVMSFLLHFSDVGTFNGAIRRPTMDRKSLTTAFTLKLILSLGAFAACFAIAPFAHLFLEHPATGNVVRVLAFNFLITTIGFMPQVELTREQNFKALMIPGIVDIVTRTIVTLILIKIGWKYWAVVTAGIVATVTGRVSMQYLRNIPMRLELDWEDAKAYLRFGLPLLGSGVLTFVILNTDNLLVGSKMGSAQLGYYALAFSWGAFVCGLLNDTVNNVLYPAFAVIQHDKIALRRWYVKTLDLVAFCAAIANGALFVNARYFLMTFLGKGTDKWLPAEVAFQILCVYGIARAAMDTLGNCMTVLGGTKQLLQASFIAGATEVVLLLFAIRTGRIALVAVAVLIAYVAQLVVFLPFLKRTFELTASTVGAQLWPVVPAVAVGYFVTSYLPMTFGMTMVTLACRGLFTAAVVALAHGIFTKFRCFHEAAGMILPKFDRAPLDLSPAD